MPETKTEILTPTQLVKTGFTFVAKKSWGFAYVVPGFARENGELVQTQFTANGITSLDLEERASLKLTFRNAIAVMHFDAYDAKDRLIMSYGINPMVRDAQMAMLRSFGESNKLAAQLSHFLAEEVRKRPTAYEFNFMHVGTRSEETMNGFLMKHVLMANNLEIKDGYKQLQDSVD